MGDRSLNYREYATNDAETRRAGVLLTDRPDLRVIRLSLLSGVLALLLIVGIIVFVLPIDQGTRNGLLGFAAIFGYVVISIPLIWYASLVKAVYTLTREHIEEEGGVIAKTSRCIPLTYVRDVTFSQSVIQTMFGLSTITVSTTNGDRIRFQHARDGKQKRELIWNLVLSKTPGAQRGGLDFSSSSGLSSSMTVASEPLYLIAKEIGSHTVSNQLLPRLNLKTGRSLTPKSFDRTQELFACGFASSIGRRSTFLSLLKGSP